MTKKKTASQTTATDWQAKADEYLAGWQRTQAEFDNYRKRIHDQEKQISELAAAKALLCMTPILDDFRRAFAHVPAEAVASPWVAGMRQVEKHFRQAFINQGLMPIEDGGVFQPALHEAIAYEDHPELPEGTIIEVMEIGWRLNERVIKPARVRVSRGQKTEDGNPKTEEV